MCGICGIIYFDGTACEGMAIRNMMQIIKHRGPDDEGVFIEDMVGLGFVRLSIIDLSPAGHQPMLSSDNRYVMVFNGEIYNYLELREKLKDLGVLFITRTDSEVLLNAYITWGQKCLDFLNGMFAFVIYDRIKKQIFAARDRYGIKPFYYTISENSFAFCSEIPPLLSLLKSRPKPDYQSVFDFLVFNRTDQTERTFFYDVKKLQHGSTLKIENRSTKIEKWYNLKERVSITEGFIDAEEFKEIFSSAIGLRLRSDVPVGVCLSGGLDSSSIVSTLLNNFNKHDLATFSAVYSLGQYGDESEFINEYKPVLKNMYFISPDAKTLENDLMEFVQAHGEPIPSTSPYAQFKVMQLAKNHVVVTIDGQGADEELAGYHYFFGFFFKDLLLHGNIKKLGAELFHYIVKHHSLYGIKSFMYLLFPEKMRTEARVRERAYLQPEFVNKFKNTNSVSGNLYSAKSLNEALFDHFEYKLEHLLKWEDRNSMWFSIEARVPFLDYRLVEKSLSTVSDLIIKKGMTKYLLRESMKGILPEKIRLRRDKIGFGTPQDEWFRTEAWQKKIHEIIQSESFKNRGLIIPEEASRLYKQHLSGKKNLSNEIWKWIHLEEWFRAFID